MSTTVLFDFDGVIADTEPQYDLYYNRLAQEYKLGIDDFPSKIKGMPLTEIIDKYFAHCAHNERDNIIARTHEYELQMTFRPVSGVIEFIQYLDRHNYKKAIVTSSPTAKMDIALQKMQLNAYFPVVITADHITKGKPDPMCYLLAAAQLHAAPSQCVVFEDSLSGIAAARNAAMKVIGVATTIAADTLQQHVQPIIEDFSHLTEVVGLL
ncbi:MAG: HAD family phosphatase [Prevotellaceae bacterium]|jgi:HAD superfamily hydrolase (TIGR01509 family)|nr:HAD family phosphatase [Prevotellaceae bacterium]